LGSEKNWFNKFHKVATKSWEDSIKVFGGLSNEIFAGLFQSFSVKGTSIHQGKKTFFEQV
jgi:hypothetical protein